MMQKYKDAHNGKYPGVISTFGFGYTMDSPLLRSISHEGDGMYSFIPDVGFVGTAFVNALSNTLVTCGANAVLTVEPENGATIVDVVGMTPHTKQSWGISVPLGVLQFGQTKDIAIVVRPGSGPGPFLRVVVKYDKMCYEVGRTEQGHLEKDGPSNLTFALSTNHAEVERCRLKAVRALDNIVSSMASNQAGALVEIREMISFIRACQGRLNAHHDAPERGIIGSDQAVYASKLEGLLRDFDGQITEATSRMDWWNKWGKHYLPSLQRAHELQQCNNFKDPGIQHYCGRLFNDIRDIADNIFNSLPAPVSARPTSSRSSYGASSTTSYTPAPSMSTFNSASAPCFHGNCSVLMANKESKRVSDVCKGDIVQLATGEAQVVCVVKTVMSAAATDLVQLPQGLVVTAWHPVRVDGVWTFPCQVEGRSVHTAACDAVFSFVVKNVDGDEKVTSGMMIDGVECITLGHAVTNDPVASHPYFGSIKVVEDLRMNATQSFADGLVTLDGGKCILKDATGLVSGFQYA